MKRCGMRYFDLMVVAFAFVATSMVGSAAAATVGTVRHVAVGAYGTPPEAERETLFRDGDIYADELVETVAKGALHLRFRDGTELRLGESSEATLDRYVYNASTGDGDFAVDLTQGAFLFITGALTSDSYSLATPVGVIGVRGTILYITISTLGIVTVTVLDGAATMALVAGKSVDVANGETVAFGRDGSVTENAVAPRDAGVGEVRGMPGHGRGNRHDHID